MLRHALFVIALNVPVLASQAGQDPLHQFQSDLRVWQLSSRPSSDENIVVFSPPLPIDQALYSADYATAQTALLVLTDTVPYPAPAFQSSARKTYDIYDAILTNREPEVVVLTNDEKKRLKNAERILLHQYCWWKVLWWHLQGKETPREPSGTYSRYLEYSKRYATLQTTLAASTDEAQRAALIRELGELEQQWNDKGNKALIEKYLDDYRHLQAKNPETLWVNAATAFHSNTRTVNGVIFPMTTTVPAPKDWIGCGGWRHWQNGSSSADVKIIRIHRKWLDQQLLFTDHWQWSDGTFRHEHVLVSDGGGIDASGAEGELMPLLPIAIMLAKNVTSLHQVVASGPVIAALLVRTVPKMPSDTASQTRLVDMSAAPIPDDSEEQAKIQVVADGDSTVNIRETDSGLEYDILNPPVKAPLTTMSTVKLNPGDTVRITAGGCVQTGGSGKTWKRYVDPTGPNSTNLYHGLIEIPGIHNAPIRISSVADRDWVVPCTIAEDSPLILGYEDDDYSDNGYWSPDEGTENQCIHEPNAFVRLVIHR